MQNIIGDAHNILNCHGSQLHLYHFTTLYTSLYFNESIKILKGINLPSTIKLYTSQNNNCDGHHEKLLLRNQRRCHEMSDVSEGYGQPSVPPLSLCNLPNRSKTLLSSFVLCISFLRYTWFTAKCREQCTCGHKRREYKTPWPLVMAESQGWSAS